MTLTATFAYAGIKSSDAGKVYAQIWGESGLDPQNKYAYYAFYVSNAENDSTGINMNGYHAFSCEKKKGSALEI